MKLKFKCNVLSFLLKSWHSFVHHPFCLPCTSHCFRLSLLRLLLIRASNVILILITLHLSGSSWFLTEPVAPVSDFFPLFSAHFLLLTGIDKMLGNQTCYQPDFKLQIPNITVMVEVCVYGVTWNDLVFPIYCYGSYSARLLKHYHIIIWWKAVLKLRFTRHITWKY